MTAKKLGRKQNLASPAVWHDAAAHARQTWPDHELDNLIDRTVDEIRQTTSGQRVAYAWSGGKDSLALQHVCTLAGIEDCVLAISELEFPEMLAWITDHMPPGLTILSSGHDLTWLRDHPSMLFPQGSYGPRWFAIINHWGQTKYVREQRLDLILLGRRRADGNYTGRRNNENIYTNRHGVTRYSPLSGWTHEAVFSLLQREKYSLPPCYGWPRGYQVGTGSWPARQWTHSVDHGFSEVWNIDPDVIHHAATELPQAADWLHRMGLA